MMGRRSVIIFYIFNRIWNIEAEHIFGWILSIHVYTRYTHHSLFCCIFFFIRALRFSWITFVYKYYSFSSHTAFYKDMSFFFYLAFMVSRMKEQMFIWSWVKHLAWTFFPFFLLSLLIIVAVISPVFRRKRNEFSGGDGGSQGGGVVEENFSGEYVCSVYTRYDIGRFPKFLCGAL